MNQYPEQYVDIEFDGLEETVASFTVDVLNTGRVRVTHMTGAVQYCTNVAELGVHISALKRDIRNNALASLLPKLINSGEWHFPYQNTPLKQIPLYGRCVYFAYDPDYPHIMKVGQTESLRNRLKGLAETGTQRRYIPVAYCNINQHKLMEQAVLNHLRDYVVTGNEYLKAEPVHEWLRGIYSSVEVQP